MNNKGGKPGIFNQRALYAQDVQEVFICEGAFDALSVIEAGAAAIALNSTSNADALVKKLEERRTRATLILCLDNDDAGRKAAQTIRGGLQRLNIPYRIANIAGKFNDPNERLQKDRAGLEKAIHQAIGADSGENEIDEFFEVVSTDRYKILFQGYHKKSQNATRERNGYSAFFGMVAPARLRRAYCPILSSKSNS